MGMTKRTKVWASGTAMAVRAVLAGAYRGKDLADRPCVTHAVLVDADGSEQGTATLCRRVKLDRLVDVYGMDGASDLHAPTCPECAKRAAA